MFLTIANTVGIYLATLHNRGFCSSSLCYKRFLKCISISEKLNFMNPVYNRVSSFFVNVINNIGI